MTLIAALENDNTLAARLSPSIDAVHIALLGCGNVGSAFAALAQTPSTDLRMRITHALVRDCDRPRPTLDPEAERVNDGAATLATSPDVVVELLGGIEPARSLVLEALFRRIPVITANKSLLAAHGPELREAATRTATPLLFEAAVVAGVPFLGTFARRPHAATVTRLTGIVNGTSNYVLTSARDTRRATSAALADAQRLGYAEPDPSNDIEGADAAEKLVVLLQLFAGRQVRTASLEIIGIGDIGPADIELAAALGGTLKPLISADWTDGLVAFVGPAFVPVTHVLASVDGVENAVSLHGPGGRVLFRGPGAGPQVTAAAVMDDVLEAVSGSGARAFRPLRNAEPEAPATCWFVVLNGATLPPGAAVADLLASYGVFLKRTTGGQRETFGALTWPVTRERLESALRAVAAAARCDTKCMRALEDA